MEQILCSSHADDKKIICSSYSAAATVVQLPIPDFDKVDGDEKTPNYVTGVRINDKLYYFKAVVTEYHPLTCTKCGGQVELKNGFGQCPYCRTNFSATIAIQEI